MTAKVYIGVIGSGENVPKNVLHAAEEVGRLLAEAGAVLVSGGRRGVMEAACRGAKEAGGITLGILPGLTIEDANPYLDIAVPTGLGFALRNFVTIRCSDALIMLNGEVGTLAEAILSYQHAKPLVVLASTGGWAARLREAAYENGSYLDLRKLMKIAYSETPADAVQQALRLAGKLSRPPRI